MNSFLPLETPSINIEALNKHFFIEMVTIYLLSNSMFAASIIILLGLTLHEASNDLAITIETVTFCQIHIGQSKQTIQMPEKSTN